MGRLSESLRGPELPDSPLVRALVGGRHNPPGTPAYGEEFNGFDLRPLSPGEGIRNPDGSHSTEYAVTISDGRGGFINAPSLWMTPDGVRRFSEDDVANLVRKFEHSNQTEFPRFRSIDDAVAAAEARSLSGGNQGGPMYRAKP